MATLLGSKRLYGLTLNPAVVAVALAWALEGRVKFHPQQVHLPGREPCSWGNLPFPASLATVASAGILED